MTSLRLCGNMHMTSHPLVSVRHEIFHAILRTKPAPAYPARFFSRVTLRQNTTKLAEIGKRGVFKQYVITFLPFLAMLRQKSIRKVRFVRKIASKIACVNGRALIFESRGKNNLECKLLFPCPQFKWRKMHWINWSRATFKVFQPCLPNVKARNENCIDFVILSNNRWLDIEVTARQKCAVARCPSVSGDLTRLRCPRPRLDPDCSKAIEGIHNVEKMKGAADLDSADEAAAMNVGGVSLEEVALRIFLSLIPSPSHPPPRRVNHKLGTTWSTG